MVRPPILLALAVALLASPSSQAGDGTVAFFWGAQVSSGTKAKPTFSLPGEGVLQLKAGDGIQFYFAPVTRSFVYLLHKRPDQTLTQLLPAPGSSAALDPGADRYLPGPDRDRWFVLDKQVGSEAVYLIVSAERLDTLDAALRANGSAKGAARFKTAAAVLSQVAALRAQHPPVTATTRPTTIAGTFRGTAVDPAAHATEVTASKLFVRAYIIEHR